MMIVLSQLLLACLDGEKKEDVRSHTRGVEREDLDELFSLTDHLHLADISKGEDIFLDFGTASQNKYTMGDWNTGYRHRVIDGAVSYTHIENRAYVYFSSEIEDTVLFQLHMRSHSTNTISPSLNQLAIPSLQLKEQTSFQIVRFQAKVQRGENTLELVFGEAENIGEEEGSAALDWIAIGGESLQTQRFQERVSSRQSLFVLKSSEALSWPVQVQKGAKLEIEVEPSTDSAQIPIDTEDSATPPSLVRVRITDEKGSIHDTLISEVYGVVDLQPYRDQLIRIKVQALRDIQLKSLILGRDKVEMTGLKKSKNVIIFLEDTLRASKLNLYNPDSRVQTPALDAFAQEAMVFEHANTPENWTKPSVASLFTGQYPRSHEARTLPAVLSEKAQLLSEQFKAAGFRTGGFVANSYVSEKFGFVQGWDVFRNFVRESGYGPAIDAENVLHHAGDWVEKNKEEPFFLYIQTIDPHVPYDPPVEYIKMYDPQPYHGQIKPRKTPELLHQAKQIPPKIVFTERDVAHLHALHDGEITQHDKHMGSFITRLKELELWDNTVFMFTSDHGEEFGEHGLWGHGHSVYDELIHVPLIIRTPDGKRGRYSGRVSTMDIAPTALELVGAAPLPMSEARSLKPVLQGLSMPYPEVSFSDFLDERRMIASKNWKFLVRGNLTTAMFDLAHDPGETTPITAPEHAIPAQFLRVYLGQFLASLDRGAWLNEIQNTRQGLKADEVQMDERLQQQLKELGYIHD